MSGTLKYRGMLFIILAASCTMFCGCSQTNTLSSTGGCESGHGINASLPPQDQAYFAAVATGLRDLAERRYPTDLRKTLAGGSHYSLGPRVCVVTSMTMMDSVV